MTESKTPRTDAVEFEWLRIHTNNETSIDKDKIVYADFARTLELEIEELRENFLNLSKSYPKTLLELDASERSNAEMRDLVIQLRDWISSNTTKDVHRLMRIVGERLESSTSGQGYVKRSVLEEIVSKLQEPLSWKYILAVGASQPIAEAIQIGEGELDRTKPKEIEYTSQGFEKPYQDGINQ